MSSVTTLPYGRPLTRADLETMPDDGHRYELIDGVLIVSPAPRPVHQRVVANLLVALRAARPGPEFEVLTSPLDVVLADDTVLQPDVLVARAADFTDRDLSAAPLLAVEVLSASTRRVDQLLKPSRLEAAGCPAYWTVDPDVPALWVRELRDGCYADIAYVEGKETFHATTPFPVAIAPAELLAP
ncbi:Uma2 family endonuclease [Actinopolymorpha alba]|uniref:Uma2 family endonuclease n=1 Tax=Actinopolymorpha alba TaxID=533267 RepID=UPI00036569EC|nr:Uma2 family endonuclease [Actinopolymorpha alba]